MSAVPLADLKAALNITTTASDAELQARLDEAEAEYEQVVGPLTGGTSRVDGGPVVILPVTAADVTGVTYTHGGTVSLSDVDYDPATGLLRGPFAYGTRNLLVTWTVRALPANHRAAIIADVAELWSRTQRGGGSGRPSFGGGGAGDFDDVTPGRPLVLFPRIRALAGQGVG